MKRITSLLLVLLLTLSTALSFTACGTNDNASTDQTTAAQTTVAQQTEESKEEVQEIGQGETVFRFEVVDDKENVTAFDVHTDQTTVGAALQDCKLIEGDESEFGLYVKTVNGLTADYDTDGAYWAFFVNGAYASSGVDSTNIEDGVVYSFVYTKE